jgi:hypothetical protein
LAPQRKIANHVNGCRQSLVEDRGGMDTVTGAWSDLGEAISDSSASEREQFPKPKLVDRLQRRDLLICLFCTQIRRRNRDDSARSVGCRHTDRPWPCRRSGQRSPCYSRQSPRSRGPGCTPPSRGPPSMLTGADWLLCGCAGGCVPPSLPGQGVEHLPPLRPPDSHAAISRARHLRRHRRLRQAQLPGQVT